jgi:hypothetical protein
MARGAATTISAIAGAAAWSSSTARLSASRSSAPSTGRATRQPPPLARSVSAIWVADALAAIASNAAPPRPPAARS